MGKRRGCGAASGTAPSATVRERARRPRPVVLGCLGAVPWPAGRAGASVLSPRPRPDCSIACVCQRPVAEEGIVISRHAATRAVRHATPAPAAVAGCPTWRRRLRPSPSHPPFNTIHQLALDGGALGTTRHARPRRRRTAALSGHVDLRAAPTTGRNRPALLSSVHPAMERPTSLLSRCRLSAITGMRAPASAVRPERCCFAGFVPTASHGSIASALPVSVWK